MALYRYIIITPDNSDDYGFSPRWWENYPTWNYYVRTDQRYPGPENYGVWIGGGGVTLEQAIASAEFALKNLAFVTSVGILQDAILISAETLIGSESPDTIQN